MLPQIQFFWEKLADEGRLDNETSAATPVPRSHQEASGKDSPTPGLRGAGRAPLAPARNCLAGHSSHLSVQEEATLCSGVICASTK